MSTMNQHDYIPATLEEARPCLDNNAMILDGLDEAVVGHTDGRLVYSDEKIIKILMAENDWDYYEANDWLGFNIHGLVGEGGPCFVDER